MVVKTRFTHDDFRSILTEYNVGSYTQSEAIERGTVQTNYFVDTTQGKFVLRYYEVRSKDSVLFESDLLTYLTRCQYPCPHQVKNVHGAYVGDYRNRPYVLFDFLEGHHVEQPSAYQNQQLIQKAAELQKLTEGYDSPYLMYRWNYTPDLCRKLAQAEANTLNTQEGREKLLWLERELGSLDLPETIPQGVCHCDFHFSNVLFQGEEFVALLDFDDANYTYLSFDLVMLVEYRAWPHREGRLNIEAAREVVAEYMKHRALGVEEMRHLYDVYKLSILFDCVWYFGRWSGGSFREKKKIEYLNELGRQRFYDGFFSKGVV